MPASEPDPPRTEDVGGGSENVGAENVGAENVPLGTLTPYLVVADARRAMAWYIDAFGARPLRAPIEMPDGRIGHAEVVIGRGVLMFADEHPELGLLTPRTRGGVSQSILLQVSDVDATVDRAVRLGAELTRPVAGNPYGRNGIVTDPDGHRWMVTLEETSPPAAEPHPGHGEPSS